MSDVAKTVVPAGCSARHRARLKPRKVKGGFQLGREWAKNEGTAGTSWGNTAESDGVAEILLHHEGEIVEEIASRRNHLPGDVAAHPVRKEGFHLRLGRNKQRFAVQHGWSDALMACERGVAAHEYAPSVLDGQSEGFVAAYVHGINEEGEVKDTALHALCSVVRIAAEEAKVYAGVLSADAPCRFRQQGKAGSLGSTDGNVSDKFVLRSTEFSLSRISEGYYFFSSSPEVDTTLSQGRCSTGAMKELNSELILQIHDLAGESRLGYMQSNGGPTHRALFCNRQKITQNPQFHGFILSCLKGIMQYKMKVFAIKWRMS